MMSQPNRAELVKTGFILTQNPQKIWRMLCGFLAICISISLSFSSPTQAHFRDQSYIYLKLHDRTVGVRTEIAIADLNRALDLNLPLEMSKREDITPYLDKINRYIIQNTDIKFKGESKSLLFENYRFLKVPFGQFLLMSYSLSEFDVVPRSLDIRFTPLVNLDDSRKNLLVIEDDWKSGTFDNEGSYSLVFTSENPEQSLDLSQSTVLNGFISTVKRGLKAGLAMREYVFFLAASALAIAFARPLMPLNTATTSTGMRGTVNGAAVVFTSLLAGVVCALGGWGFSGVAVPWRWVTIASAIAFGLAALELVVPLWRSRLGWLAFAAGLAFGSVFAERVVKIGMFEHYGFLSWLGLSFGFGVAGAVLLVLLQALAVWVKAQNFSGWVLRGSAAVLGSISLYWIFKRGLAIDVQVFDFARSLFQ